MLIPPRLFYNSPTAVFGFIETAVFDWSRSLLVVPFDHYSFAISHTLEGASRQAIFSGEYGETHYEIEGMKGGMKIEVTFDPSGKQGK